MRNRPKKLPKSTTRGATFPSARRPQTYKRDQKKPPVGAPLVTFGDTALDQTPSLIGMARKKGK